MSENQTAVQRGLRFLSIHGLLTLLIVLLVTFSLLKPDTFPTAFNIRTILNDKSIVALLALGVMIPLAAEQFDLSVGWHIGLAHILAVGLQVNQSMPWPIAVCLTLLVGVVVGLINGLLVTRAYINSFIATLGMGTILFGVSNWYTGGKQVLGTLGEGFKNLTASPGGIPLTAIYVLVVAVILWIVFEYLPVGRFLYVLGANPRAGELTGIASRRYITAAFMASGFIAAFAGVVLASRLRVGQATVGLDFLLPAFVGALLGSTSVRPGRVNVWGTILAVLSLAVAVAGLQQLGAAFFVEPLFNGAMLILAVGLAGYAARRRERAGARATRDADQETMPERTEQPAGKQLDRSSRAS